MFRRIFIGVGYWFSEIELLDFSVKLTPSQREKYGKIECTIKCRVRSSESLCIFISNKTKWGFINFQ